MGTSSTCQLNSVKGLSGMNGPVVVFLTLIGWFKQFILSLLYIQEKLIVQPSSVNSGHHRQRSSIPTL